MRSLFLRCGLAAALTLAACADDDSTESTAEDVGTTEGRGGRGGADAGTDTGSDTGTSGAVAGGDDAGSIGDDASAPVDDAGSTTDPVGGCTASSLDDAIECQVAANDAFVAAFCDCFTDVGYDGDRAACEADQPSAEAFRPDACTRAALLTDEAGSVRTSLCYADAAFALADCIAVCPPDEASFQACFDAVGTAFDACDAERPAAVVDALEACTDDPTVDPGDGGAGGSEDGASTAALRSQRDDYVTAYCGCAVGSEFSDLGTCRRTMEGRWDPGLSACEAGVFASMPAAAAPFVTCITESFLIAETACMECPEPGSLEYDLCADPAVDINFCFMEADGALQDALLACRR